MSLFPNQHCGPHIVLIFTYLWFSLSPLIAHYCTFKAQESSMTNCHNIGKPAPRHTVSEKSRDISLGLWVFILGRILTCLF